MCLLHTPCIVLATPQGAPFSPSVPLLPCGDVQTHPVLLQALATLVLHLHPSVQVSQDPLVHLGILAFHFVPAALVGQEGRPVALVGPVGIIGIELTLVSLVGHLEGLVDHLVALSVQMTFDCTWSWC